MQGSGSSTQGEISFISWNRKVQQILASTSYNGTTGEILLPPFSICSSFLSTLILLLLICVFSPVIWDLRKQKPLIK